MLRYEKNAEQYKQLSNIDLVEVFLRRYEPEQVIGEVFRYFSIDCLERCKLDPARLDALTEKFFSNEDAVAAKALGEMIGMFRALGESEQTEGQQLVEKITAYVESHLCENIRLEQIAKALSISYFYMCHLFKLYTGTTLTHYRNKKRVLLSQKMLIETDKKVADIAVECGFESVSYFSETFKKYAGVTPLKFREEQKDTMYFPWYYENDIGLANMLPSLRLLNQVKEVPAETCAETYAVHIPEDAYQFLHETAIIEYHGTLFASWYNCPETELHGRTPIRGRRSKDGGKTWDDVEIVADCADGGILYCPPVYGVCNDKLYLFLNEMVGPDLIHALDLFVFDEEKDVFVKLWSRPIPFKLNTNVVTLPNGKFMLPGRIGEIDRFPNTPAVLICDSKNMEEEWRLVKIAPDGNLPDGSFLIHPEISAMIADDTIYMLCRNDIRMVPILYCSKDNGETWSTPYAYDIPMVNSKIYCGDLKDGRHYLVANIEKKHREKLALYLTEDEKPVFTKCIILQDEGSKEFPDAGAWHYPVACESDGKLYIIYTAHLTKSWMNPRGAVVSVIDLSKI